MLSISPACKNENTYGLSCTMCGKCGRKFSINGVNDEDIKVLNDIDIINNVIKDYSKMLESELYLEVNKIIEKPVMDKIWK